MSQNPLDQHQGFLKQNVDIAVIGIASYYPGASGVAQLWENILARRVQFRRMLDQRMPIKDYFNEDPKFPDTSYLTKAAFIEDFNFDWGKLRIPKQTVESTDIAHWLALDTALKTFEDAGFLLNDLPLQNTGVIVGNTLTGEQTRSQTLRLRWPFVKKALNATLNHLGKTLPERTEITLEMEKIYKSAFYPVTEDSLAGGLANTIAGRICNYLNLKGGGYIVDGACSSSLLAVATAADALKMGNMDLALAGGVDISLDPFELVGFAKAGALSVDQMRVYDNQAKGFLPGEGCGFVLLKRLSDAKRDKNYVYAVLKGWGISSDGKGGIMEPSSSGQSFAIGRAYKDLDYKIADVDFVEGHGTGTTKGDRVELEGIATAVDLTIKKENISKRSCGVTSFKSIVGHTKAAAGIGGFLKAVMAVNQRVLPPTATCVQPNEVFKDKARNLYPIINGVVLPAGQKVRAGISSAGFGGINCHVTVESLDPPKPALKPKLLEQALFVSTQETELFTFSTSSILRLQKFIIRYKEDLRNISFAEMADLAAFLNSRVKKELGIKVVIVTDSPERLYQGLLFLENFLKTQSPSENLVIRLEPPDTKTQILLSFNYKKCRLGFLYPGQGSQRLNMTRVLIERFKWAQDLVKLSKLPIQERIYLPIDKFITKEERQEAELKLADTRITQAAIVLSSLIWTEFLSRLGIEPEVCAGHSLGELMAFYKAGAFNKEALIQFAELRGELMATDVKAAGSMASLMCSRKKAEELISKISGYLVIANINHPNQIVVSGGKAELAHLKEIASKENIPFYPLNVSNAFHSRFMQEASAEILKRRVLPTVFKPKDRLKVYSCMNVALLVDELDLNAYFSKQVVSPVDFVETLNLLSGNCDLLLEVGPGRVLTDLARQINPILKVLPIESNAGSDRDLNLLVAELFVHNFNIKLDQLYLNRLTRPFVLPSKKKFIENQCERPLIGEVKHLEVAFEPVIVEVKDKVVQSNDVMGLVSQDLQGMEQVGQLLVNLVHKITGFETESIKLNLRLLDDLNLDSIKAAELIGQAARQLGVPGQVDPSQLSNKTLEEIAVRLLEVSSQAKAGVVKESTNDILKRYQQQGWVRDFVSVLDPQEITTRNVNQFKALSRIAIVSNQGQKDLNEAIALELKPVNAHVQTISFDGLKTAASTLDKLDCVLVILPKNESVADFDKSDLKNIFDRLHLVSELVTSKRLQHDAFVVFVQFGGGHFGENKHLRNIAAAASRSFASTLFLEHPNLKLRVIDFEEAPANLIAGKIIEELQSYESFNVIAFDTKLTRHVACYRHTDLNAHKKRTITWSKNDLVLVTGGAKGITAQCALAFARITKARMVLIGRTAKPANSLEASDEINQTLKQFESEGLFAAYYACDVANDTDVLKLITQIKSELGSITGFIHGAGLNSLRRLKNSNVEEVFQESLPKVMGAVNICQALKEDSLKLIVGITSIIGLTGMEGSGWYGLANEILNLYLYQYKMKRQTQVLTIAYSVWDEVGMGAKLDSIKRLGEKGIGAIGVKEGVAHFTNLVLNDPGTQQVIVAARVAGIATWKNLPVVLPKLRFIEQIEHDQPGIELIVRAHLNVTDDSYLLDHNWKGSLLFPFVFGFEAMTQAVAYVLGVEEFQHIKARDIDLQRPIAVSAEVGTTIEIHALVLDQKNTEGDIQIKVDIYSQESAYKEPHFSAVFEVNLDALKIKQEVQRTTDEFDKDLANKVIDLDMDTDIYGPVLFQGKLFQGIEKIHELYYDEELKKGECVFTSVYNKSTQEFLSKSKKFQHKFLTGDPFFIDTLLQSIQLVITPRLSLPNFIKELLIDTNIVKNREFLLNRNHVFELDSKLFNGTILAYNKLSKFISLKDCKLKVLENLSNKPNANELADVSYRYQKIIDNNIKIVNSEFSLTSPNLYCYSNPKIQTLEKESRREIENEIMKKLIERNMNLKKVNLEWLGTGKPYLNGADLDLSISHDKDLFMCALGSQKGQGCDIESIKEEYKSDDWLSLLGSERFSFLKEINKSTKQDMNYLGTCLWSVCETIKKSTNNDSFKLNLVGFKNSTLVFNSSVLPNDNVVVVIPLSLTKNINRVISFVSSKINNINIDTQKCIKVGKYFFENDRFNLNFQSIGTNQSGYYSKRFPITFKHVQNLSNSVYFSNYFDWIGDVREFCLSPIIEKIREMLETGQFGMATNQTKLEILGQLKVDDVVEVRLYLKKVSGKNNSVFDLAFDWFKVNKNNNELERIALAEQRISWIQITGHGEGLIIQPPEFFKDFMNLLNVQYDLNNILGAQETIFLKKLNLGNELLSNVKRFDRKILLYEKNLSTTLVESNLVGNVYFANYAKWLGATRDSYFHRFLSDYFTGIGEKGEFQCLNTNIDHLGEAMPFDNIRIMMYLDKIYENGLDLFFEFYKVSDRQDLTKLAFAKHSVVWCIKFNDEFKSLSIPNHFLKHLLINV